MHVYDNKTNTLYLSKKIEHSFSVLVLVYDLLYILVNETGF